MSGGQQHESPQSDSPLLGTDWVQAQLDTTSPGQEKSLPLTDITNHPRSPSLCLDLSDFRRHLQRYRKLDDSINLSLNRSFLLLNNSSRSESNTPTSQCGQFWKLLTTSWLNRERLIRSCIEIADESVKKNKESILSLSQKTELGEENRMIGSSQSQKINEHVYTMELKRRMIHDELTVESTIRKQTMQKFKSRCPDSLFVIPSDAPPVELSPHPN